MSFYDFKPAVTEAQRLARAEAEIRELKDRLAAGERRHAQEIEAISREFIELTKRIDDLQPKERRIAF